MSVVVDSSVVVAALLDAGATGGWAERVIEQGSLHAPELIRAEVTGVLRRLERSEQISKSEANAAFADFMELHIELLAFDPFSDRIWELRESVSGQDAWYIAVAEVLDLPLATLDSRLTAAAGPKCPFLTPAA